MSEEKPVQLGLCCMNTTLKLEKKVYASRKIIVRIIDEKGIAELKSRVIKNGFNPAFSKLIIFSGECVATCTK